MYPRVFVPELGEPSDEFSIPGDEAAHLARVLRVKAGAFITVFDGKGGQFDARVETARGNRVTARLVARSEPAREASVHMTLAQAVLKGHKMDDVVRDAVMLGVADVQPLVTEHTELSRGKLARGLRVERWKRIALSSVKQCGRAILPSVQPPVTFRSFVEREGRERELRLLLVEPSARGDAVDPIGKLTGLPKPARVTVTIGPEGGWSSQEIALAAAHGHRLIAMGARTLRADAVPLAAISVLMFLWGDL